MPVLVVCGLLELTFVVSKRTNKPLKTVISASVVKLCYCTHLSTKVPRSVGRDHWFLYPAAVRGTLYDAKVKSSGYSCQFGEKLGIKAKHSEKGSRTKLEKKKVVIIGRHVVVLFSLSQVCLELRSLERLHQVFLNFLH